MRRLPTATVITARELGFMADNDRMEKLVSLCKRRGFVFQSSEIYGGLGSVWDYGPLGVELKRNIKDRWWRAMVHARDDIEGLDAGILMHPRVWEASGHVATFTDPLVDCKHCKNRFRADDPKIKGRPGESDAQCPVCGTRGSLTAPRLFNLMFKTFMGPVEEAAAVVFLRPETAQGIYVNYLNVLQGSRQKVPFGIAQVGKAFRNEITPGNFIFRTREFEQMEMQFFVRPGTDDEWFEYWREQRMGWHRVLLREAEKLRWHQVGPEELAHYAKAAYDIEYEFPFGWSEFEGIHNRTDYDLKRHQEYSGKKLEYFDQERNERYIPYVVETSAGADRLALVVLCDAYDEDEIEGETRVVMRFRPDVAPIKAAVLPLVKKDGLPEIADRIFHDLKGRFNVFYDDGGSIGRRYRRQDEAGTPFCVTVDGQSKEDGTVTVRHRDTLKQDRVAMDALVAYLVERLGP
jgi:glycyl-tRNA synthetase